MKIFPLRYPISGADGSAVTSVTLRRAKARDMLVIGDHLPALSSLDGIEDPAKAAAAMDGSTFKALIAVVGTLGDLGDAAGDLDLADLTTLATEAVTILGEAQGSSGAGANGAP